MSVKNVFYAQSGGVTAVINASASAVIQTCRSMPEIFGKVFAGKNGIFGALHEELIDTDKEPDNNISSLRYTPGGAFGSCRYKLQDPEKDLNEFKRLLDVFKAHDIGYFFYNGGGDSADTCFKISQFSKIMGYPIQAIHIPKTIDNDLPITDCCPGFGSVAKYIATSTIEASFDVRSMCRTSTRIFVLEVMGRHAGWIAAAGGLAVDYGIPVVVLFPEIPFQEQKFLERVENCVSQYGYCTVVVSEGAKTADGKFLADQGAKDVFGHAHLGGVAPVVAQLIRDKLGHPFHWAVANYLQRSARHIVSAIDLEHAYELGVAAVHLAAERKNAVMPTIVRLSDEPYRYKIGCADLKDVANVEKFMPSTFIASDGFSITDACKRYLYPLMQGEQWPPFSKGLPCYVTLENQPVPKLLEPFVMSNK